MRVASFVMVSVLSGCLMRQRVVIDGPTLHRQGAALHATGRAEVVATVEHEPAAAGGATSIPETITIDQTVHDDRGKLRWIRDLLRGCADDDFSRAANPDCELVDAARLYELRRHESRSLSRFAGYTIGATLVTGVVGTLACSAACEDGTRIETASNIAAGVMGAGLVALVVWMFVDCSGRWGQPGCRD